MLEHSAVLDTFDVKAALADRHAIERIGFRCSFSDSAPAWSACLRSRTLMGLECQDFPR